MEAGRNVSYELKGDKLIITMELTSAGIKKAPKSSTGKTNLVASTGGYVKIGDMHGHKIALMVNVTAKPGA